MILSCIELGGALKNVFAIAAGVSDGPWSGEQFKSCALLTRAMAELLRLGTGWVETRALSWTKAAWESDRDLLQ